MCISKTKPSWGEEWFERKQYHLQRSFQKLNNVGEIDIPFYMTSDSRLICTTSQKGPNSIIVKYSYLFSSVSDS